MPHVLAVPAAASARLPGRMPARLRVLVLGGSGFIGQHLVRGLCASGHAVTVFGRSRPAAALPVGAQALCGDRDDGAAGLAALAGRRWDACVDISGYTPRQVLASTAALAARVGRYVYISAVMAYALPITTAQRPVTENQPLHPPAADDVTEVDGASYGPLKAACEAIVRHAFGDRATVLRPQTVAGPGDNSLRLAYWVQRAALGPAGGPMLAPGDGSDGLQLIDVRDLAAFVQRVLEQALPGVFNLAGPRLCWRDFMHLLGVADPVWVPAAVLQAADLAFGELPLYRAADHPLAALMDVSPARAQAAGLVLSEPAQTLRAMQDWIRGRALGRPLSAEREAALIAAARRAAAG